MDVVEFSLSCHSANTVVKESGSLRFLKQWVPGLPKITRNAITEHIWTIGQLEAAIRAENCVSYGELSGHIFIPTMERICNYGVYAV